MASELLREVGTARRVAALELNAQAAARGPGQPDPTGLRLASRATPIYDLNGQVLFNRFALQRKDLAGWVDVAASPAFGAPVIATSYGALWDPVALIAAAAKAAGRRAAGAKARFVAYSFPKLAVEFSIDGREVALIETYTGEPVPKAEPRAEPRDLLKDPPSNFERWSLLDSIDARRRRGNEKLLQQRLDGWDELCPPGKWKKLEPRLHVLRPLEFADIFVPLFQAKTRELHYSSRDADHVTCYEVRGQLTGVWCVAASVQMVLDFYRYEYDQDRVATELGLGTQAAPSGLPYSRVGDIATALQDLSSGSLTSTMITAPTWKTFTGEIDENRPLVSIVPGHARTVAGYNMTRWGTWYLSQQLLVYDPWPPTSGVITRWEDFTTTTHQYAFASHVTIA